MATTADVRRNLGAFLRVEQVGGLILLVAAALALIAVNSPLNDAYEDLRGYTFGPESLDARLNVEQWAADGLLALFFFVAGLEVKRELVVGELSDRKAAALPVLAALGGMVVPALIYVAVTGAAGELDRGWAVPTATDIAFALGVLAIAGSAAPASLRVFLLSLAVVDDLAAITIIAVVFTDDLRLLPLAGAAGLFVGYALAQRLRIRSPFLYVPLAVAAWLCVHASGVHATVAGVALGLLTRVRLDEGEESSPADRLEHRLQPWSAGLAVPIFAFTAAGVAIDASVVGDALREPAAIGVFLGLVVGKIVGIGGGAFLAVRLRLARLPDRVNWVDITAVAILGGTGFTVSMLIAQLAYSDQGLADRVTLAVLVASVVASVSGALGMRLRRSAHLDEARATDRDAV